MHHITKNYINKIYKKTDMGDIVEKYSNLEGKIIDAQKNLRNKNQDHYLLNLVEVDETGIHWKSEFGKRYIGMSVMEGLKKYVKELEQASSELE